MKDALKKFFGKSVITSAEEETKAVKVEDSTYITSETLERVLMMKGWKPGKRVRTRSKSLPPGNSGTGNSN